MIHLALKLNTKKDTKFMSLKMVSLFQKIFTSLTTIITSLTVYLKVLMIAISEIISYILILIASIVIMVSYHLLTLFIVYCCCFHHVVKNMQGFVKSSFKQLSIVMFISLCIVGAIIQMQNTPSMQDKFETVENLKLSLMSHLQSSFIEVIWF